jgi:hypothetical protein
MEVDELIDPADAMPFPREDAVMTISDWHHLLGMRRVSHLSPRTPTHCGWGCADARV